MLVYTSELLLKSHLILHIYVSYGLIQLIFGCIVSYLVSQFKSIISPAKTMTLPQLYRSAFSETHHRCDGVCVRFDWVSWYFLFVWDALQVFIKFVIETGHGTSCLATDIYWKLWNLNLMASLSDCSNFSRFILFYLGDTAQVTLPFLCV